MFKVYKRKIILLTITIILIFSLTISYGICEEHKFNMPCTDPLWGEGGIHTQLFVESVRIATEGGVDIKVFPGGEWGGSEEDYTKDIQLGTLDLTCIAISPIGQFTDALTVFDVPFLFKGPIDETLFIFESPTKFTPIIEKLVEQATKEANFIILGLAPIGRRDIFSNKPINDINGIRGLKIRTMGSSMQVDAFNFLGTMATPMPTGECYAALKMNVIDAMENSPDLYIMKRIYEVAPYWVGTNHYSCVMVIIMSKKAWDSLPAAYQNIVKNCAMAASYTIAQWAIGSAEVALKGPVKKLAKTMFYPTKEEQDELREKVLPKLLDKYGKQIGMGIIEILAKEDEVVRSWYEKNK